MDSNGPEGFRPVGRLVARGPGVAGVFTPFPGTDMYGVYEIREVLGELQVIRLGDPAMDKPRLTGLDLDGVFAEIGSAALTEAEWEGLKEKPFHVYQHMTPRAKGEADG